MWKYKRQIQIRWISFFIGLLILGLVSYWLSKEVAFSPAGIKVLLTRAQVEFEMMPFWVYPLAFIVTVGLMLLGIPSIYFVIPVLLLKSCTFAFLWVVACQMVACFIAMEISYKIEPLEVTELLAKKLSYNETNFQSFAFWARVYYNIPLRTVDRITPLVHNSETGLYNSLIAAASAILIRICIPTLLVKYAIDFFTFLEPNPELERSKLLLWATVLIIYTVLPKAPELLPGPKRVKMVIKEMEFPSEAPAVDSKQKLLEEKMNEK